MADILSKSETILQHHETHVVVELPENFNVFVDIDGLWLAAILLAVVVPRFIKRIRRLLRKVRKRR